MTIRDSSEDTDLVVDEILSKLDLLFLPIISDERSILEKCLDYFNIEMIHFQVACGTTGMLAIILAAKMIGPKLISKMGFGIIIKESFLY